MINTMEINPDELPALDLFENCRLCLAKDKVSVDIFSDGHEIRHLYYKIVSCFPVNVTQDDKLPRKICTQCNEKVDDFYQFWTLTAKSQKTLLEWVEKRELLPTTKIKTEDDVPEFKQEAMDYNSDDDNEMDRYDDDNSEEESSMQPAAIVKVLDEGEEGAVVASTTPAGPSTTSIKLRPDKEGRVSNIDLVDGNTCDAEEGTISRLPQRSIMKSKSKCSQCKRTYKSQKDHERHILTMHTPGSHTCNVCGQSFFYKSQLTLHMRKHSSDKPFACPDCSKAFKTKCEVVKHHRIVHEGKKYKAKEQYKCQYCPRAFVSMNALEDHQYSHTGEKTRLCHMCPASFATRAALLVHIKVIHEGMKKPQETCRCEQCDRSYTTRISYNRHMKTIHGDGKPKCHICGKIVCSKEFLVGHINSHTGEKPFSCEFCGRSFGSKTYLVTHRRIHTGESPYKCNICSKGFKQRSALTQHHKSRHGGELPNEGETFNADEQPNAEEASHA